MFLVSSHSCLRSIHWSQVLSWEWRCSWSSTDRQCSNYIWVINNFIAYKGATFIRCFKVVRPEQNTSLFRDTFKCIFLSWMKMCRVQIEYKPALYMIMAWSHTWNDIELIHRGVYASTCLDNFRHYSIYIYLYGIYRRLPQNQGEIDRFFFKET